MINKRKEAHNKANALGRQKAPLVSRSTFSAGDLQRWLKTILELNVVNMSKKRIIFINLLGVLVSIGIGTALAFVKITSTEWAIVYSFLSSIFIFVFTLTTEIRIWPKKVRVLRNIAFDAQENSKIHPVLGLLFQEIVNNLGVAWKGISDGIFIDDSASIPQLSISTVNSLNKSAFATYIDDPREVFYVDTAGKRYLQAWYDKAKSLDKGAMCRVFILQDIARCSHSTLNLIKQHRKNAISIRVITLDTVIAISSGCEIDFGIFDETCLMTVAAKNEKMPVRLSVIIDHSNFANKNIISQYKEFRDRLIDNSSSYEDFIGKFSAPINREFWNYWLVEKEATLMPPHGVSRNDANAMLKEALNTIESHDKPVRVGILGLTPMLIEVCNDCNRVNEIVLIDQSDVYRNPSKKIVEIPPANWLTVKLDKRLDVILGDESLNNIRSEQYHLFFQNMFDILNDDGCVFLRCMGRFNQPYSDNKNSKKDFIEEVRKNKFSSQQLSTSKVIKYLHSEEFGFDPGKIEIDSSRYNQVINRLISEGSIMEEDAGPWLFPSNDASKSILLTSPEMDNIRSGVRFLFSILPLMNVDDSYCLDAPELSNYYKVIGFVKQKAKSQPDA